MLLGAHIGTSDGLAEAAKTGRRIGCDVIQIFSKSPQMWKGSPISPEAAEGFRTAVREERLRSTAVHHSYLINLASPKPPLLQRSRDAFVEELRRAETLGVNHLIFHPGAHIGAGAAAGLARIVESLNYASELTPGLRVRALLENAAGQGTTLCASFGELATVLDGLNDKSRFGVALDTCHLFAAGFDFRTPEAYGSMCDRLDSELGVARVQAFHLNDSKADVGEHLDRHENIGRGKLGTDGFRQLVNDRRWREIPGYLETPLTEDDYVAYENDLKTLRKLERPVAPGKRSRSPR
jgi:deoxyribonuclease IV